MLLKAMANIYKKRDDIYLVVAGSVWKDDREGYEQLIDELNIREKIKWDIRYIPDDEVKFFYSAADVCVLPYTDVYQSGVIQLVYAYKKAAVASKLTAFTQFVKEDETGYLAEINDVDSLQAAIEKAYNNKANLNRMGELGHSLIDAELGWDKIAKQVQELYLED